jgi:hypothetical protein
VVGIRRRDSVHSRPYRRNAQVLAAGQATVLVGALPVRPARSGRPNRCPPNVVVKDIACGANHSMARDNQNLLYKWGCNQGDRISRAHGSGPAVHLRTDPLDVPRSRGIVHGDPDARRRPYFPFPLQKSGRDGSQGPRKMMDSTDARSTSERGGGWPGGLPLACLS